MYYEEEIDEQQVRTIAGNNGNNSNNLISILQEVQDHFGYVPKRSIKIVSDSLNIYPSRIFGVVTFYSQFSLMPKGDNIIRVCEGTACHVRGCDTISAEIGNTVGLKGQGTTSDKKFTVEHVACVGACAKAPVITINDDVYGKVEPEMVEKIIAKY